MRVHALVSGLHLAAPYLYVTFFHSIFPISLLQFQDGIKAEGAEKLINLKVMSLDKTVVHFQIKRTTSMLEVSGAFVG